MEKLKFQVLSLTRSALSTWLQAVLHRLDPGSSHPDPSPLLSELQFICPNSLLILQLFLTPALLCRSIPIHTHPSYPLSLLPVFLWLFPLPWTLFSLVCYISVTTDLPCYLGLVFPCFTLFPLVYQCNVCPWSSLSIVSGILRRMFLSLVHIYIRVANQQLLSVVHFLRSLVHSFRKTSLSDAC